MKNGLALNARLRGDAQLASEVPLEGASSKELAQQLDAAMSPSRRPRELLRGIGDPATVLGVQGNLEGHEFDDPGFVSTTTDEEMAELFGRDATLRINAPRGILTLDLEDLNQQREVLLGRGLRYRVTGDKEVNDRRILDVEVLRPTRRRRGFWLWLVGGAAAVCVVTVALAGTIMAILGSEVACVGGGGPALAAPATRAAEREIDRGRLRIYQAAGRRIDIDWSFLAAIGEQECGSGNCVGVNSSGCAGPMQIAYVRGSACSPGSGPTIWELYRVDGDGDGVTDINNPADAVFTAARILRKVLSAPPAGGSFAAYREAACGYYGACADGVANYADEVMARAVSYGFDGKGSPSSPAAAEPAASGGGSSCGSSSAAGASGNEIVRIAQSQLGTGEDPPGSNCNPYGPCVEWCSLFVSWVWKRAGVEMEGSTATYAYSGTVYEWAVAHEGGGLPGATAPGEPPFSTAEPNGARVLAPTATPAPGDAVLYGSGPTASDHIGIVERVFSGGQITTIDGNFGNRVARSGPFLPSQAVAYGMPAPIFGYAHPPSTEDGSDG